MIRFLFDKIRLTSVVPIISRQISSTSKQFAVQLPKSDKNEFVKDVIVYSYDNSRRFKLINIFAISQMVFWGYLGNWAYTEMRYVKVKEEEVNEEMPWYRKINLGEGRYKNTLAAGCFLIGYLSIVLGWTFTLRSVRNIIMRKDGKTLSLVCYTPFGKNRIMDVPIKNISVSESRTSSRAYLPIKVKDTKFYYLLDMKGEFKNTRLFDNVIALNRKL